MLDKRFILENAELVQQNCDARGMKADVARYVKLETECRSLQQEVEELSRQANVVSKSIGQAKDDAEREARKEEGRKLRELKESKQADHARIDLLWDIEKPREIIGTGRDAQRPLKRVRPHDGGAVGVAARVAGHGGQI